MNECQLIDHGGSIEKKIMYDTMKLPIVFADDDQPKEFLVSVSVK